MKGNGAPTTGNSPIAIPILIKEWKKKIDLIPTITNL